MIEIGIVKSQAKKSGTVEVDFAHIDTVTTCNVLQSTTGDNILYILPSVGTQVVCSIDNGINIVLGAIYSDHDTVPLGAKEYLLKIGNAYLSIDDDHVGISNSLTDLKTILKDILSSVKNLTVSTPQGASGVPLPPTILALNQCEAKLNQLLK